jgi:hypothetical protein
MVTPFEGHRWEERRVQEWLLLLLRFAITQDRLDESAALAMADEFDSWGMQWRPASPRFFLKTSEEVCAAILAGGGRGNAVLRKHASRIADLRLKRAFQAAVGILEPVSAGKARTNHKEHSDLWRGLRRR